MAKQEMNRITTLIGRAWQAVSQMMAVSVSRRQLAELDDATLHDLGISRAQARFEAARQPWDISPPAFAGRGPSSLLRRGEAK